MESVDCLVIGAGAAGLFCSIEAGKRGRRVLVVDHANKPGKKILMSGGGRCNFTNLDVTPENYLGKNPHFPKSALSSYTQWSFIDWVESHKIAYHEKARGQLFCTHKAKDLLAALLSDCEEAGVEIRLKTEVVTLSYEEQSQCFVVEIKMPASLRKIQAKSVVIASGGLSIPTMGASPFAYKIAEQFSIPVEPVRAGLVPFTLDPVELEKFQGLPGVSLHAELSVPGMHFLEDVLFTHRGLSGPAVLQISSYWTGGDLVINWLPKQAVSELVIQQKKKSGRATLKKALSQHLPNCLVSALLTEEIASLRIADLSNKQLACLESCLHAYVIKPSGTEGYRTAEVTLGGVDTDYLSSKTMAVKTVPGLYFIGEAVDVTGWLGGFNFQWAWSSGWAAGQNC